MKFLVTGAGGFVGRGLVKALVADEDNSVVALYREPVGPDYCDARVTAVTCGDLHQFDRWQDVLQGVDCVIHLAAAAHGKVPAGHDPSSARSADVELVRLIATQCKKAGSRRFIFLSSIGVFGNSAVMPVSEAQQVSPAQPYAHNKWLAECELKSALQGSAVEYVIIRPPLVYGAEAPGSFRRLIAGVWRDWPLPFKGLKNQRSMVALENLLDFILCAAVDGKAANETFVVADNERLSTAEIVECLARGMGKKPRLFRISANLFALLAKMLGQRRLYEQLFASYPVDNSKACELLEWQPVISASDALRRSGQRYSQKQSGS